MNATTASEYYRFCTDAEDRAAVQHVTDTLRLWDPPYADALAALLLSLRVSRHPTAYWQDQFREANDATLVQETCEALAAIDELRQVLTDPTREETTDDE